MILTQEQTLEILWQARKLEAFKQKYKQTTKFKWKCLKCLKPIYISYKQYGRNSIFCDDCLKTNPPITIVQMQCIRVIKDKQLAIIEKLLDSQTINNEK